MLIDYLTFLYITTEKSGFLDGLKPSRNWKKKRLENGPNGFFWRLRTVWANPSAIQTV
jgi:hypothetical protein